MVALTRAQVDNILSQDSFAAERAVLYSRRRGDEEQQCFATKKALSRFVKRFQKRQGNNTTVDGVHYIRQFKPTPLAIRRKLATWLKKNNSRCKVKILRGYLLQKERMETIGFGKFKTSNCYRYFYESKNTRLSLPNELPTGWYQINNKTDAKSCLQALGNATLDVLHTPDTTWTVPLNNCLTTTLLILPLNSTRYGKGAFPEDWVGIHPLTTHSVDTLCFFRAMEVWKASRKKAGVPQGVHKKAKEAWRLFMGIKNTRGIKRKIAAYKGTGFADMQKYAAQQKINIVVFTRTTEGRKQLFRTNTRYKNTVELALYEQHVGLIVDSERFAGSYYCPRCGCECSTKAKLTRHMRTCVDGRVFKFSKGKHTGFLKWEKQKVKLCKKYKIDKLGFICGDFETYVREHGCATAKTVYKSEHYIASHAIGYTLEHKNISEISCILRKKCESERDFLLRVVAKMLEYHAKIVTYRLERFKTALKQCNGKERTMLYSILLNVNTWYFNGAKFDSALLRGVLPHLSSEEVVGTHICKLFGRVVPHGGTWAAWKKAKIRNYRIQDKNRRPHGCYDGYVTPEWLDKQWHKQRGRCAYCEVELKWRESGATHCTIDRVDESLVHTQENCLLSCCACNCKRVGRRVVLAMEKLEGRMAESEMVLKGFKYGLDVVKCGTAYKYIFTDLFTVKDILTMNAPMSLDKWSKAFSSTATKLAFPYELVTSLDVLDMQHFPPIEQWSSWLKNSTMLKEEWCHMKSIWDKHNFKNLGELLAFYNEADIAPMLQAWSNQKALYREVYDEEYSNFASLASFAEYISLKSAHDGKNTPLFPLITKEHEKLYNDMMANKQGGFSQVMCRLAEVGKKMPNGRECKCLLGTDANALYLWALGEEMPCDYYEWDDWETAQELLAVTLTDDSINIILKMLGKTVKSVSQQIRDGWNGFVKVDAHCTKLDAWKKMCFLPMFQSKVVNPNLEEHIGPTMRQYMVRNNIKKAPQRKLLNTSYVRGLILYAPYVRFLQKTAGLKITKVYYTVKTNAKRVFGKFCDKISNARRIANIDGKFAAIGQTMKTVGNSAYGRFGMDSSKFTKCTLTHTKALSSHYEEPMFMHSQKFDDNITEVVSLKKHCMRRNPIMLSIAVYQQSKLKMLEYIHHLATHTEGIVPLEGDTDSFYMALPEKTLAECVIPRMRKSWDKRSAYFFPSTSSAPYKSITFMGATHMLTEAQYFKYERGLFKDEARFDKPGSVGMCISAKCYRFSGPDGSKIKTSHKGAQNGAMARVNPLTPECRMLLAREKRNAKEQIKLEKAICEKNRKDVDAWKACLGGNSTIVVENRGIRQIRGRLTTYSQLRESVSFYYDKHVVQPDGISCGWSALHILP